MKVIIVGSGIGGLTTAIALKNHNIDFEVFEAAPEIREVGAGIWVPPNAMNVFDRLGIGSKVKNEGKLLDEISVGNHTGTIWQTIKGSEIIREFGNGTTAIHRGRLQSVLYKELDSNKIHPGKRFKSFSRKSGKVVALFEDGSTTEGDILIGADGIHSAARNQLFGPSQLRYSGQTCWRSIIKYKLSENHQNSMVELWGKESGQRFAYSQINENEVYFYATYCFPKGLQDEKGTIKNRLKNLFESYGPLALSILDAANEENIIRTDLFDLKPIKSWVKDNIALIGDAAHATTPNLGQGGAQAIEDAFVIAKCLSEETNLTEALLKYQSVRYKKATFIVNTSWTYGQLSNLGNPLAVLLRNNIMKYTPDFIGKGQIKKIYRLNY